MTFPLGSLRADGADVTPDQRDSSASAPGWRVQAALLVGAVAWLLAVLALSTHNAGDPGFSTSGNASQIRNGAGVFGAWFSDFAFFVAGYSVWWAVLVGARAWLGALARSLRAAGGSSSGGAETGLPAWTMAIGLVLLLAASASLEWTRLYQWEAQVAGGTTLLQPAGEGGQLLLHPRGDMALHVLREHCVFSLQGADRAHPAATQFLDHPADRAQPVAHVRMLRDQFQLAGHALLAEALDERHPEVALGREMVVDAGGADAHRLGQVTEAERRPADVGEPLQRCIEQRLARARRSGESRVGRHGMSSTYR